MSDTTTPRPLTVLARIQREPAKLLAFATAILAVLTGTGVLTETGATIALGVVAASVGLLSYFVTPAGEVVAQQLPGGALLAGRAALAEPGTALVSVGIEPVDHTTAEPGEHRRDDGYATWPAAGAALGVLLVVGALVLTFVVGWPPPR